jgi:tRNA nucleotidyltransferase (CCA-adding enzyme)
MNMKSTQISPSIQRALSQVLNRYDNGADIITKIVHAGGRALLVGGAVRDLLLELPLKDLDIEVHQLSEEQLSAILQQYGPVSLVGKSFGVLRLHGLDIDWSLPRADSSGRKPEVIIDPGMGIEAACRRRDLTMNAMAIDLHTLCLIDVYGGQQDLAHGLLRETDADLFVQDPLRFFRVMQFISRFSMRTAPSLDAICSAMDISGVSVERIEQEFHKMMLSSPRPSLGLRWLVDIGRLRYVLPELDATRGIAQNPEWHPEGDVFEHTMQAIDAAASITANYTSPDEKRIIMYAALCHDLGKVTTTHVVDGVIKSEMHAQVGEPIARRMMRRISRAQELIDAVCLMVLYHMEPGQFVHGNAKAAAYKRLARKLAPHATLLQLSDLARADRRGRNAHSHLPLTDDDPDIIQFRERAIHAQVFESVEQPILNGRDLLDSVPAGPELGALVRKAYEIQLEEGITDAAELKRRVLRDR